MANTYLTIVHSAGGTAEQVRAAYRLNPERPDVLLDRTITFHSSASAEKMNEKADPELLNWPGSQGYPMISGDPNWEDEHVTWLRVSDDTPSAYRHWLLGISQVLRQMEDGAAMAVPAELAVPAGQ